MCAVLILLTVFFFFVFLREDSLTVHLISESAEHQKLDMQLQFDGKIILSDSISSGVYFGKTAVIGDVDIGFHEITVTSSIGDATYEIDKLVILNKTIIICYWDGSESFGIPYFESWTKFGKFIPD